MSRGTEAYGRKAIDAEPWVELDNGATLADWGKQDEVDYNQASRQSRKHEFFVLAFDFICDNRIFGDYHEYGCHRCRTFRMALTEARRHNVDWMKFHAFDSFEGLPTVESDTSIPIWKKGALVTSEEVFKQTVEEHGLYVDRCRTIKGFYDASLTVERQREYVEKEAKIALACIDCDLYESAVPVFKFIEPLLQEGTVLYIDDYYTGYKGSPKKGVAAAFAEFQEKSAFKFEPHLSIGWWGRSFIAYR